MSPGKPSRKIGEDSDRRSALRGPEPLITVLSAVAAAADGERIWQLLKAAEGARYQVIRVRSCEEALGRLDGGGVDVVLLELALPDSSGLSTVQRVMERAPHVPVVVLASSVNDPEAIRAVRQGAQGYVAVPDIDSVLLDHALRSAVERHRALRGLLEREERCHLALRGTNDGVWDWDLRTDSVFYSARWFAIFGYPERDQHAGPEVWFDLVHPDDIGGLRSVLEAHFEGSARNFEYEVRMLGSAGDYQWVLARGVVVRDLQDVPRRAAGSLTDITERKRTQVQLLHHALHDELTGLANRALFVDRVELALGDLRRNTNAHFAVLFCDLDRFKKVNDTLGHSMGDRLLIQIGRRLRGFLRPGDTLARLGGDEFAILLGNVGEARVAVQVGERIRSLLSEPFVVDGHELAISASVGVALSTAGYTSADELLHDADVAMYRAKAIGRGQCQVFDPDMHRSAVELLTMESELRDGVADGDFVVYFQPIVSLETGQIAGFEALVRWDHPERGRLAPTEFLAVAERSALIVPIGWWAMEEACRQARVWCDRFVTPNAMWVSINVSGKLLMQVDMVDHLRRILETTGLEPGRLRLELAEELVMEHGQSALAKLRDLRRLGVRLVIDDFGLGTASINYLQLFQYDALKIRPSYIGRLESISPALVKTTLVLAGDLGIDVVAEGVETAEQAVRLRQLECPHAQGFWFARPMPATAAEEMITATPEWWIAEG